MFVNFKIIHLAAHFKIIMDQARAGDNNSSRLRE
jgi:hypothetical protein